MTMRHVFFGVGLVCVSATACGGNKSATTPTSAGEPTDANWSQLAAQLSAIGVDAVQQAVSITSKNGAAFPSAVPGPQGRTVNAIPLTAISWSNQYPCCGSTSGASSTMRTNGQIAGSAAGAGTVDMTESLDSLNTMWTVGTGSFQIQIAAGGLKLTSSLVTSGADFQPVQQFKLVGSLTYIAGNGTQKSAAINLVVGYRAFPTQSSSSQPPTATGQFGPASLTGGTLPDQPPPAPTTPPIIASTFTGPFNGSLPVTVTSGAGTPGASVCSYAYALSGTATVTLQQKSGGTVTGTGNLTGTEVPPGTGCSSSAGPTPINWGGDITGTASSFTFSGDNSATGGGVTVTNVRSFSGGLAAGVVPGTISYNRTFGGTNVTGGGSTTMSVTLR
jgi:hypothetical protein